MHIYLMNTYNAYLQEFENELGTPDSVLNVPLLIM